MRIGFKSTETFLINSFLNKDVREAELLFVFILKIQRGLDREERETEGEQEKYLPPMGSFHKRLQQSKPSQVKARNLTPSLDLSCQ